MDAGLLSWAPNSPISCDATTLREPTPAVNGTRHEYEQTLPQPYSNEPEPMIWPFLWMTNFGGGTESSSGE